MTPSGSCQVKTKTVISASRRTDLVSFFPGWLADSLRKRTASVIGPSGRIRTVDLSPDAVHTLVLWSKDFSNLLSDRDGLRTGLVAYDQAYFHFTVTGLGGTGIEPGAPRFREGLAQLPRLVELAGDPRRVSLRFDPVVFWEDGGRVASNVPSFSEAVEAAAAAGVADIRFSFAQWYRKARARAARRGFPYRDPPEEEKKSVALRLAAEAGRLGLNLFACSQAFLTGVGGIRPSACIDGRLLTQLHPRGEPASMKRDGSQRTECLCTESVDIGSYTQACPHGCVYCYANPKT